MPKFKSCFSEQSTSHGFYFILYYMNHISYNVVSGGLVKGASEVTSAKVFGETKVKVSAVVNKALLGGSPDD